MNRSSWVAEPAAAALKTFFILFYFPFLFKLGNKISSEMQGLENYQNSQKRDQICGNGADVLIKL